MEADDNLYNYTELMIKSYSENGNLRGIFLTDLFDSLPLLEKAKLILSALDKTQQLSGEQVSSFRGRLNALVTQCTTHPQTASQTGSIERVAIITCLNEIKTALQ